MSEEQILGYNPQRRPCPTWEVIIPRIPDQYIECSVYLYASHDDAVNGVHTGGSGFIVSVPCERRPDRMFMYCVTNAHVIEKGGRTIRFNAKGDEILTLETTESAWVRVGASFPFCRCLSNFFLNQQIVIQ